MADKLIVNLPFFPGFYDSILSGILDSAIEREGEYCDEKQRSRESYMPEDLRLEPWQFAEIVSDCVSYRQAYQAMAADYCAEFDNWAAENLGTPENAFQFESMDSPREYNFATDRFYVTVDESIMARLLRETPAEQLAAMIKQRHSSYDGFHSFYSNKPAEWLAKPLDEWDHNELGTLLSAAMAPHIGDNFQWDLCESLHESDYEYLAEQCDWQKVDEKIKEYQAGKLANWIQLDCEAAAAWIDGNRPDSDELLQLASDELDSDDIQSLAAANVAYGESHYRCPFTPDLFA